MTCRCKIHGERIFMTHKEKAKQYFLDGYNCAQAVVLAYQAELGLDAQTAARLSSAFGGGMGRLREVCGACSGMFLVTGMLCGYDDPAEQLGKKELYQTVQDLANAFREKNGSILCRDLLNLDHTSDDASPSARTKEYYQSRPCAELVACAAELLEEMLAHQSTTISDSKVKE